MNNGITKYINSETTIDILTNKTSKSYPLGYSYELINSKTINWCHFKLNSKIDRELAISWVINNKSVFPNQVEQKNKIDYSKYNLCVDTPSDFENIKKIYKALYSKNNFFGLEDVMQILQRSDN